MANPFLSIPSWIPRVLETIKKDIKTEHLTSDPSFYRTYFGNRPQNRLTTEEIFKAYEQELLKGNPAFEEFVVNRWVFKHGDIYRHFAERLQAIHEDFEQIQTLTEAQSEQILAGAVEQFGAINTYLFTVLNAVVFPSAILERLKGQAEKETAEQQAQETSAQEKQTLEQMVLRHQREVARLNEKYESKLAGVQKKYATDMEALKKQIRSLQQKLNTCSQ